jgi:ABC-2 type transport system ATP-binding protein
MIDIERVSKRYGELLVLSEVTLHVARGERVALIGANGSGKTTLLRAMLGLVRVQGRVLINGVDVAKSPELALTRVAYVPQIAPPLEAPVRELVRALASLRQIASEEVAVRAALLGLTLTDVADRRLRDLSGGMKQKLLAALALASDPEVLICDEPTANLDARARQSFFEQLEERRHERALILCSHRAEDVSRLVDRVIELDEGRVVNDRGMRSKAKVVSVREELVPC